jgi:hypothetical protein
LKPGPIESIATMICVAFEGAAGGDVIVSVLCGAGGGLTVHAVNRAESARIAVITRSRLAGTPFRVSAGFLRARGPRSTADLGP